MADTNSETHGEVKSPGAQRADDFYATPAEETPQETPEVTEEPVIEAVTEEPTTETVEVSEEDTFEPTSIEQLAEHLETEPDWVQGLTIKQKVNGKEIDVKIADALSTHRKVAAADDYLADAKTKAKATIEQAGLQKEQLAGAATVLGDLLKTVEDEINSDTKDIDWAKLRREDPAEYSAKKEEIRERHERVKQMKAQAAEAYQQTTMNLQQQQQQLREQNLPKEHEVFLARVPEWSDEEVAKKEQSELVNYLSGDGYSQQDIEIAAYNGKLLALAVKAMRYDQSKGKVEAAKKKVVKIPKVLKPGKPADEPQPSADSKDRVSILYGSNT